MSQSHLILLTGDIRNLDPLLQEQIYKQYYQLIYPTVMYIMKDHSSTEDIIQEAFLNIIRKSPHNVDEGKLIPWLRTIARNTAISYLRKNQKKRDELFPDSVFIDNAASLASSSFRSTESEVEAKLMEEAIVRYIHQLKPIYRYVLQMRWMEQLSYKEMAERLGVSEEKVRTSLHRSREAIKRKIEQDWKVAEP
ncbi:RNA polymerase sigma factor [Paenibacillus hamazuiensis]|uniref:RNA polymerase sigma factor n=1 Tax=Paenibacillus hamazuiensis TaxID=2936508 RepID=UPI00200E2E12|nr:RNA polymerase sigma factor [Paenibacillus hamazuiensis]